MSQIKEKTRQRLRSAKAVLCTDAKSSPSPCAPAALTPPPPTTASPSLRAVLAALAAALVGLLVAACSLAPPAPVPEAALDRFDDLADPGARRWPESLEWWKSFADPVLDQVMATTLDASFDLAEAVARVDQARARARIAAAARFPAAQASLGVSRFDAPTNAGLGAQLDELGLGADVTEAFGFTLPDRLDLTTYSLGADFAYEADFWGRHRNAALAAGAEHLASEADFQAARIGVLAETVATYLEIVDLRCQWRLADELAGIFEERASLAAAGYERGRTDIRDLYAAQRALADAQAELPRMTGRLADAEARLWILLGGHRPELERLLPDALEPSAPSAPAPAGIPADLLAQRPDVNAARQRMEAARFAVGARRAALLPALSLSGFIGLQATESGDWFDPDQWFENLSANLLLPVFQGGRLRGNLALAEAQLAEAGAAFGRSVVTAVNEVEAALAGLRSGARRVALLTAILEAADAEAALQERRYLAGVADYGSHLGARQLLVGAESALAGGRRDLAYARLALHRALGGAWTKAQ
ncbi:MAG: efflux transporter outer membrane subunit [Gammaproteobacteria bacterium]|nr:efflux transporter outer membrane subunit [Gammaproteobacteria bacterium]